jgi:hypothetical protein
VVTSAPVVSTEMLRRRGIRLAILIVVWDVIEGAIAVTAGVASGAIALVGFGIDSSIEVFAASVVLWQLHGANGLSVNVLVGLGLNAAFGWSRADPTVAGRRCVRRLRRRGCVARRRSEGRLIKRGAAQAAAAR